MQKDELFDNFAIEFKALVDDKQPILLEITKLQAWTIFCQIQLALRHPENTGPTANIARAIAIQLARALAPTPALAEVAKRGWDAKFDIK